MLKPLTVMTKLTRDEPHARDLPFADVMPAPMPRRLRLRQRLVEHDVLRRRQAAAIFWIEMALEERVLLQSREARGLNPVPEAGLPIASEIGGAEGNRTPA
jgi:hypothetical protein